MKDCEKEVYQMYEDAVNQEKNGQSSCSKMVL